MLDIPWRKVSLIRYIKHSVVTLGFNLLRKTSVERQCRQDTLDSIWYFGSSPKRVNFLKISVWVHLGDLCQLWNPEEYILLQNNALRLLGNVVWHDMDMNKCDNLKMNICLLKNLFVSVPSHTRVRRDWHKYFLI